MLGFGKPDPVPAFWAWLKENEQNVRRDALAMKEGATPTALLIEGIGDRLRAIHASLVHEIGIAQDGRVELIISADGVREAFQPIIDTVAAAPELQNFKITAFRPRQAPGIVLEFAGHSLDADGVRYVAESQGERLGLTLFFDAPAPLTEDFVGAGFILLDTVLGEYDVETGIGYIEFEAGGPRHAKRLSELAEEFDAYRAAAKH